ncbi:MULTISPECIES: hypothetical protein [Calothrix]|uniref:hypothetical protein n=1 Tax=Calothrix TaxID=1186 RepID=UPI001F55A40D|nr:MULTISPECIES: hypothetical protein [Calothrix]
MKLRSVAVALSFTIAALAIFIDIQPSTSNVSQKSNQQAENHTLEIVKNRADLIRLHNQRVKIIGNYTSTSRKPNPQLTGIPGFAGLYIKAQIVLEDGTKVSIFPSWNKQSLRSPEEVEKYNDKIVEAIGVVQFEAKIFPNSSTSESFIELTQLNLYSQMQP